MKPEKPETSKDLYIFLFPAETKSAVQSFLP